MLCDYFDIKISIGVCDMPIFALFKNMKLTINNNAIFSACTHHQRIGLQTNDI